jgi:hypothetical protein
MATLVKPFEFRITAMRDTALFSISGCKTLAKNRSLPELERSGANLGLLGRLRLLVGTLDDISKAHFRRAPENITMIEVRRWGRDAKGKVRHSRSRMWGGWVARVVFIVREDEVMRWHQISQPHHLRSDVHREYEVLEVGI